MLGLETFPISKIVQKALLAIADFSLIQECVASSFSVDQIAENRRGNSKFKRKKLTKWEFYLVLVEERMTCVNATDDDSGRSTSANLKNHPMRGHTPAPCFSFNSLETNNRQL